MIFTETYLAGAYIIDLEPFQDERGFFTEAWNHERALQHGVNAQFKRSNISLNTKAGTLRGLHAQKEPYAETKLVRCVQGTLYDVMVDMRPESTTYLQWMGVELSAENLRALLIPRGFLHGFQTLVDNTMVFYQTDGTYNPEAEYGVRFDDPALNVQWPSAPGRIISPKDQNWPALSVTASVC